MFINGIEYNIRFYVTDGETGEDIAEELFEDLDQMNSFIEKTWHLFEYADAQAEYVFVEVVCGKPDAAGVWGFQIPVYMPLADFEIEDVLYEMEVVGPKEQEELQRRTEKNQIFLSFAIDGDPGDVSKNLPLSEYAYVCPRCINEVEQCTCNHYPGYLIQIDRLLVPVIRELNRKGYQTSYCCAGHPFFRSNNFIDQLIYIAFRRTYDFSIPFPNGSKYRKSGNMICYDIPDEGIEWDADTLRIYQEESIHKLLDWAEALPRCNE